MEETPGCGLPSRGPMPQEFLVSFADLNEVKERIRESVDISDLVGSYIELRRQGPNFVGLCPWHGDSSPSLTVTPVRQTWRCWVCGIGGDAFSFVQRVEGVEFPEAVRMLADRAGIELPKSSGRFQSAPGNPEKKRSLLKILEWAEKRFHDALLNSPKGAVARDYLEERGFNQESIERYRIGCSPKSWSWLLDLARQRNIPEQSLVDVGLVSRGDRGLQDFFVDRLIFPIHDLQNRPIAFGGRVLPGNTAKAKYKNSPDTPFFKKRSQLYGLNIVRAELNKTRSVTIMEGFTDVVVARQLGVQDAVAVLGTAFGEGHIKLLQGFVDQVTLVLDGDEAGRKRANDLLNLFISQKLDLRVLTLPDELDPCDYIATRGVDEFNKLREAAPDALEQKLRNELDGIDPLTDIHRGSVALENIIEALSLIPRAAEKQRSKELLVIGRLARIFQVKEEELENRLRTMRRREGTKKWVGEESVAVVEPPQVISASERELLEILVLAPHLVDAVMEKVPVEQIGHAGCREIYQLMGRLSADGVTPDFATLLAESSTLPEQSLLVDIDTGAQEKAKTAGLTPEERWEHWYDMKLAVVHKKEDEEKRRLLHTASQGVNENEAIDVLKDLLERKRARTID
jgi:DNA primase